MFKLALFSILFAVIFSENVQGYPPTKKIHPDLLKSLDTKNTANIFINLDSTKPVLDQLQRQLSHKSRAEKRTIVAEALKRHAATTQSSLVQLLRKKSINYQSFWITNQVFVRDADIEFIQQLAKRSDVFEIKKEVTGKKIDPAEETVISTRVGNPKELEESLKLIGVQEVYDAGINGTGVRVAIMDTGEYGWFDPNFGTELPVDSSDHGTHCLGTILGQGGIGVAPGAKWMACQNIPGSQAEDLRCAEQFVCPTLPDNTNPDCSKGADLVSNRDIFGGDDFFDGAFDAWEKAGIVPIFSAGNNGNRCYSCGSPGDSAHPALITVGASDVNDELAGFSSLGASPFGDKIKPDITGPGVAIRSSVSYSDTAYGVKSGTSMSAPHVAGVVALILQAHPDATITEIRQRIFNGAVNTIAEIGQACGGIPESTYPNNQVGHGRLYAPTAVLGKRYA